MLLYTNLPTSLNLDVYKLPLLMKAYNCVLRQTPWCGTFGHAGIFL